ncbi:hypothetical protein [Neobacillus mesonae]|uniref:hypothetical protein n=1 Tax=Neobacillus mesonae TaxID=1193713 RepID=UPI002041FEF6|nr:hypothetical protein [Neobacillus mesonae]MCM3570963.1 hypothetical protein [Neobacillus mesonae]
MVAKVYKKVVVVWVTGEIKESWPAKTKERNMEIVESDQNKQQPLKKGAFIWNL